MGKERTLSLVIPARDEQENIANLLTEAFSVMRDYAGLYRRWFGVLVVKSQSWK